MSEGVPIGKALGWLLRGLRAVGEWLAKFRPPFAIEFCSGTYLTKQPPHGLVTFSYELHFVNRELTPNSVREIRFRFMRGGAPIQELPDVSFRGENIGPRASVHRRGVFQLSDSIVTQCASGDSQLLAGVVTLVPTFGKPVEGDFFFLPIEFYLKLSKRGEMAE